MRAVKVSTPAGPWSISDVATPSPGHGQVLVRVAASGVCRNDLGMSEGTPGHEVAGEIVECGPGVVVRRVGDRVGVMLWQSSCGRCEWCQRGRSLDCAELIGTSIHRPGGHAEYVIADADGTALLPDGLSFEQAAPIMCAGLTALSGLHSAAPRPGERVAVVGIGGIGHLAVQFAKAAGFHTTAVSRSRLKESAAHSLGADAFVTDGSELARRGGADVVLATSCDVRSHADALRALRPEGRLVVMGLGPEPLTLSAGDLIVKRLRVIGSQHNSPEHLHQALALAASGKVTVATETYRLEDAATAQHRLREGSVRFRAVLVP